MIWRVPRLVSRRSGASPVAAALTLAAGLGAGLGSGLGACGGARPAPEPGVLEIAEGAKTSAFTRNFNPLLEAGDMRWPARGSMYEPLLIWNPMTGQFVPWLAESFAFSADHLRLSFALRHGVRWSDGQPFGAADVAFTFELLRTHPALDILGVGEYLRAARAVADDQVVFDFKRPFVPGLDDISAYPIVPAHVWKDVADPLTFANPTPVATGPFTEVTSFQPQAYRIERNPRYWGGAPAVQALHVRAYPANDQSILAIINGEVDWACDFIPAADRILVGRDPLHHHYWFPATDATVALYANTTVTPFADARVRKAVSMTIDRARLVMVALHGYTHPADATGLSDAHQRFRDPAAVAAGRAWVAHDPPGAERLLDAAGLLRGPDGWRRGPGGRRWSPTMIVPVGFSDWVVASQIIARGLRAAGVDVTLRTLDYNAWNDSVQKGVFDLSMGWTLYSNTPYTFYRGLMSRQSVKPVGEDASDNWHRLAIPDADRLLTALEGTLAPEEQMPLYHALEMVFVREAPAIPLFPGPLWGTYNDKRFVGFPDQRNPYAPLSPNLLPQALLVLTRLRPQ
ncbi:MAG TPA: ABC transporter substrate-binding protein [Polyangia bacterium]|nr:ABC transporter substrate-binding protein [Polyangia bacterium]